MERRILGSIIGEGEEVGEEKKVGQDHAVNGEFLGWKGEEILRSIIKRGEEGG